ncbi:hypothetical protein BU26DRAFT_149724 [Trematosphaeria pertusa]|uniref:Uncharacterized protein n=1 Tax=Trematosphaeria pertusa TaxID=390896 RepID=A0A6A6IXD3_9PLEO|nr:uncharacterized protein BU26DRAFT_149724 [Trematosphaeria pertusa]KAF2255026.1 hypothetical protein BU26DRAFT_149724 [Trematosphaeria pertusa]
MKIKIKIHLWEAMVSPKCLLPLPPPMYPKIIPCATSISPGVGCAEQNFRLRTFPLGSAGSNRPSLPPPASFPEVSRLSRSCMQFPGRCDQHIHSATPWSLINPEPPSQGRRVGTRSPLYCLLIDAYGAAVDLTRVTVACPVPMFQQWKTTSGKPELVDHRIAMNDAGDGVDVVSILQAHEALESGSLP